MALASAWTSVIPRRSFACRIISKLRSTPSHSHPFFRNSATINPSTRSYNQYGGFNLRQEASNAGQIEVAILDLGVKRRQRIPEIRTMAHTRSKYESQDACKRARSIVVHSQQVSVLLRLCAVETP